jgi:hypothetical protein
MEQPTTPTKKCRRVAIVVDSSAAAVAITELFDRTARCLALCDEFTKAFARTTDEGRDTKAAAGITMRFAIGLISTYHGAGQIVADQTLFRNLEIDKAGVN